MMDDLFGYRGRRVLVSGCFSGMGRATAELLIGLGAEVHGFDYQAADFNLASFTHIDLRHPYSIDAAVAGLGGPIDALFNCAGFGPTFPLVDIVKVNFIGTRHLTEAVLPLMGEGSSVTSIASTAGMGWSRRQDMHRALIAEQGYDAAVRWTEMQAETIGEGYSFSKETVIVWTMLASQTLIRRGVRINCIMPGLTQTPMLTDQIAVKTAQATLDNAIHPIGRPATPEEQAFPLVMLGSRSASYVNGAALNVDGGRMAALVARGGEMRLPEN